MAKLLSGTLPQLKVGISSYSESKVSLSVVGISSLQAISVGGSTGNSGQYLQSTGIGLTWASASSIRSDNNYTATAGQTTINQTYTAGLIDVYVNGVRLTDSEYTASNGTSIVLNESLFGGESIDVISYTSSGSVNSERMSNLTDDTTPQLGGSLDVNGKDITGTGNVNITGIVTTTELSLSNTSTANRKAVVGSWTASAGVLTNIDTISTTDFKTVEYTLHIENSIGIQAQKVLLSRFGTTPYSQEYAIMYSSDLLVSIGSSYTGGNYYLNATPETGISGITTYNFVREIIS